MTKTAYAQHPSISEKDICSRCSGAGRVDSQIRRRNVTDVCFRCNGSGVNANVLGALQLDVLALGQRVIVRGIACEITAIYAPLPCTLYNDERGLTQLLPSTPPADYNPANLYVVNLPNWRERACGTMLDGVICRPHQMIPIPKEAT